MRPDPRTDSIYFGASPGACRPTRKEASASAPAIEPSRLPTRLTSARAPPRDSCRLRSVRRRLSPPQPQRDARLPASGSLLTRRLHDRQIVLKVLAEGFEFESRHYRSLSAIAREVTGTRWNGLLFFGLAERRDA